MPRDPFDLPHTSAHRWGEEIVWVPINPVEYHGPHLSLHTDHLLSIGLIGALHAALPRAGALYVTADLEVGVDPTPGPGTRATSYGAMCGLLDAMCDSLVSLGAKRVVLVTFHGAPLHNLAIARAVRRLAASGVVAVAPFQELVRLLSGAVPLGDERFFSSVPLEARDDVRSGLPLDFHAGFFETSLALHWAPDSVSPVYRSLPACPRLAPLGSLALAARLLRSLPGARQMADEMAFASWGAAWMRLHPFPGYTGQPAYATAEAGSAFADAIVQHLAPIVREVLDGVREAPAPPFRWVGPLTAWGRLSP